MENPTSIRDFDLRIDTIRHRLVAVIGTAAALILAIWIAAYTVAPLGVAIFSLITF